MLTELLRIEEASLGRNQQVLLRSFSLCLTEGKRVYIRGENGSGKSTLLGALLGFHPLKKGHLYWKGKMISPLQEGAFIKGEVAFLPQYNNLFPSLSIRENILMGGSSKQRRIKKRRLTSLLERLPLLKAVLQLKPAQTSIGESQIAALARVLVQKPQLLVLDEPTAGVSSTLRPTCYELISEMPCQPAMIFTDQHTELALGLKPSVIDIPQAPGELRA